MKYEPTLHDPIPMNSYVILKNGMGLNSIEGVTGVVVGVSTIGPVFTYIVLLDESIMIDGEQNHAVSIPGPLLMVYSKNTGSNPKKKPLPDPYGVDSIFDVPW